MAVRIVVVVPNIAAQGLLKAVVGMDGTILEMNSIETEVRPVASPAVAMAAPTSKGKGRAAQTAPAAVATAPTGRASKVYRVLDADRALGPVLTTVRQFLLTHPNSTAAQVITGTGRERKSVESALHGMRTARIIESVEVAQA